jgi:methyl coenzyme M reductase gamma subunit
VKVLGHLVPRETKVAHSQSLKSMSDEELEAAIEYVQAMLAAHAGNRAKVINGAGGLAALPAPADVEQPQRKRPNRLLEHVDTAVGPKKRQPRKCVPSSPAA